MDSAVEAVFKEGVYFGVFTAVRVGIPCGFAPAVGVALVVVVVVGAAVVFLVVEFFVVVLVVVLPVNPAVVVVVVVVDVLEIIGASFLEVVGPVSDVLVIEGFVVVVVVVVVVVEVVVSVLLESALDLTVLCFIRAHK